MFWASPLEGAFSPQELSFQKLRDKNTGERGGWKTHRIEYKLFIQLKLEIFLYETHVPSGVAGQLLSASDPHVETEQRDFPHRLQNHVTPATT